MNHGSEALSKKKRLPDALGPLCFGRLENEYTENAHSHPPGGVPSSVVSQLPLEASARDPYRCTSVAHGSYISPARSVNRHFNSTAMSSPRVLLLATLLTVLQLILSADAKGGGKGSGGKGSSGKGSKTSKTTKTKPKPKTHTGETCYNAEYVMLSLLACSRSA